MHLGQSFSGPALQYLKSAMPLPISGDGALTAAPYSRRRSSWRRTPQLGLLGPLRPGRSAFTKRLMGTRRSALELEAAVLRSGRRPPFLLPRANSERLRIIRPQPESGPPRVGKRRSGPSFFGEVAFRTARIEAEAVREAHEPGALKPRSGRSGQNIAAVEVLDDDLAARGRGALALEGGAHRGDQGGNGRLQQFSSAENASSDFRRGAVTAPGAPSATTTSAPSRRDGRAATRAESAAGASPTASHATSGQGMPAPKRHAGSSAGSATREAGADASAGRAKARRASTVSRWANWAGPMPSTNMPRARSPASSMALSTGTASKGRRAFPPAASAMSRVTTP